MEVNFQTLTLRMRDVIVIPNNNQNCVPLSSPHLRFCQWCSDEALFQCKPHTLIHQIIPTPHKKIAWRLDFCMCSSWKMDWSHVLKAWTGWHDGFHEKKGTFKCKRLIDSRLPMTSHEAFTKAGEVENGAGYRLYAHLWTAQVPSVMTSWQLYGLVVCIRA